MRKLASVCCCLLASISLLGQVVINEIDSDTPGTDTQEFIELLTDVPNQSLDNYVIVLFNGSTGGGDSSYFTLDLDGFTTDINGIYLIAASEVSPVGNFIISENTLQNGADAIAIYEGSSADFPNGTLATQTNLIDAIVYDTNDTDDTILMDLLGVSEQINEGANGNQTTQSIQRANDGSYFVADPTPNVLNDGSGFIFNGVGFSTESEIYDEGDLIDITFTTQQLVDEDLVFEIFLSNETFDFDDYSANTIITIPEGSNTTILTVEILDDGDDEGDELMKITFGALPEGFNRLNDNTEIRIVDNDFTMAAWGTPLNPTFNQVESTQSEDYYASLEGLADTELSQALQDIIADPDVVRMQTYADIVEILKEADQSPLNSNQVWLLYTEQQRSKLDFQTSGGSNIGLWNREHTYPRSRGDFDSNDQDDFADGIDVFVTTNADSLRHANSDAHGLRAADGPENSTRGNQDYGEYSGPDGNAGSWQGDVARAIFFLAVRYNDLDVVSGNPPNDTEGALGDLDILLQWHANDPPDDFEMNRNNFIYTWQFNRNPFIDQPDLVDFIWGANVGEPYFNPLSNEEFQKIETSIFPNPATNYIQITTNQSIHKVEIHSINGQRLKELETIDNPISLNLPVGIYVVKLILENGQISNHKLIIK